MTLHTASETMLKPSTLNDHDTVYHQAPKFIYTCIYIALFESRIKLSGLLPLFVKIKIIPVCSFKVYDKQRSYAIHTRQNLFRFRNIPVMLFFLSISRELQ